MVGSVQNVCSFAEDVLWTPP